MNDFFAELADKKFNNISKQRVLTRLHREYDAPPINKNEVLRYAGFPASYLANKGGSDAEYLKLIANRCEQCGKNCGLSACQITLDDENQNENSFEAIPPEDDKLNTLVDDSLKLLTNELTYRVSYCCSELSFDLEGYPVLPFEQKSEDLKKNLSGCRAVIIFAATIGAGIDRLIRRYERTRPATGIILQGAGAERVEALCNLFNDEVSAAAKKAGFNTHPRYSPGYGDLSIEVQPHLLQLLDAEKRLGITLGASYLMSPSKSVTAIIGIE